MNQLLNNRVGKKPKAQKRGCLFLILGSLLALLATGVYILAVSLLTGKVIEARHDGETAYALMTLVKGSYGVVLFLFYGILALWYISPSKEEVEKQNRHFAPMLGQKNASKAEAMSRRTIWLITGGMLLGVVLTGVVSVNTYRLVTPDGIRTYCFAETSRYEWKQVSAYTVDCATDDGLSMTFTMRDGKQFEILQGVNSATSDFKANYTSVTEFATVIDAEMVKLQVPRNAKHYERAVKFYKDNYPELWPHVARLIGYLDLEEHPDETAPETEPPTETGLESGTTVD